MSRMKTAVVQGTINKVEMKNSLNLLSENYSSSSSEEDDLEPLVISKSKVDYVSDEPVAQKRPLPVPDAIASLFAKQQNHDQEQSFVKGRIRTFQHERGNWATYAYIPVNFGQDMTFELQSFIDSLNKSFKPADSSFEVAEDFHISLSQTVVLQHHWIEPLVESLRKEINSVLNFHLTLQNLEIYTNEEKTRSFLGIKVDTGFNQLNQLVQKINTAFQDFKLAPFFKKPSFHVSFAWCLGLCDKSQEELPRIQAEFNKLKIPRTFLISEIQFKSGNKIFSLPMKS